MSCDNGTEMILLGYLGSVVALSAAASEKEHAPKQNLSRN